MKEKLKAIPPHTLITAVAGVAWLGSFVIRAVNPDFALGAAADALMTTVVGYWFTANHKAGDGDDLLGAVVSKNVLPAISGAHAPPKPSQPAAPPASKPYTPKPVPPASTKQGGLPWG